MKATNHSKRFRTTEISTYRLSNSTKLVSFDTIEEAKEHIENQRKLHPRSKKFSSRVTDSIERKTYNF
jgi:hypothetical protein